MIQEIFEIGVIQFNSVWYDSINFNGLLKQYDTLLFEVDNHFTLWSNISYCNKCGIANIQLELWNTIKQVSLF